MGASGAQLHDHRDTKDRILDAAERSFAEVGFAATSLRAITAHAGVNLASVNYHFGSKEALVEAVFQRRAGPVNEERLRLLSEYEAGLDGRPPEAGRLVEIFVRPTLSLAVGDEVGGPTILRLMGRLHAEPNPHWDRLFVQMFREVGLRFLDAFERALPAVPRDELACRFHFLLGALVHTLVHAQKLRDVSGDRIATGDFDALAARLAAFAEAGFRAEAGTGASAAGGRS